MLNYIRNNAKNLIGWKTKRRIVVFSIDDYGNVRVHSKRSRDILEGVGLRVRNRFDAFDSLESREDLEILYETLTSVKDVNGKYVVFTPFAVPCNIDFETVISEDYKQYSYELLPHTFMKLSDLDQASYEGTWELWQEGISKGLMVPQFHGREHLNLKVFNEKLEKMDPEMISLLKNRSYMGITSTGYPTIKYNAAFDFWEFDENMRFEKVIEDGLNAFEKVFGYRPVHFNSPGGRENSIIHEYLKNNGIRYLDTPFIKREHTGLGKYKTVFNFTGKTASLNMIFMVRNVLFEPTDRNGLDWVNYALKQIEAAFRWNRPAIISSHRVNFCGYVSTENRSQGIVSLKELLIKMVNRWPDIEFMSANELAEVIDKHNLDQPCIQ